MSLDLTQEGVAFELLRQISIIENKTLADHRETGGTKADRK